MTTLFSSTAVAHTDAVAAPVYKKHPWLPLLTGLFILSYALMTMLIVEQGSTIESQRALIRELFRDSSELSAVKDKVVRDRNEGAAKRHAETQSPSAKNPSAQDQSTTNSASPSVSNQSGSNQSAPQHRGGKKLQLVVPARPAADMADDRRALRTI